MPIETKKLRMLRNLETGEIEDWKYMTDGEARDKNYYLFLSSPRKRWEVIK